ncbi:MFS transporter [Leucobacter sp. M11]|uniref:MFS transporter n=1 Tax=Leucobacter sp. M11 TaxID=2993565 RepID=UPI002D800E76|nr:MFS transporter [Leucobacter sp. M11]MEB4615572.1 MFS transporter [Leucobacter sp. M11]
MTQDERGTTLIRETGFGYFPLALVARLPYAMMIVGVLTLVVAGRGSLQLGGLTSAAVGIGTAIFGSLIGAAADRFGQRPVLLLVAAANSAALAGLALIVYSDLPDWSMLLVAFSVGATAPQIAPLSRTRLVAIVKEKLPASRRPKVLNSTMSYESTADEVIFIFGPVIVGVLATTMAPWAPIAGASLLTLIFVTAFALHPTSRPAISQAQRAETLAPSRELFRVRLLVVIAGIFGVGLFFGAMLTSLTAFMGELGSSESAGLLYGVMGVGSAILALSVTLFPPAFRQRARWLVFGAVLLLGTGGLFLVDTIAGVAVALVVAGIGIGPTLVTLYSIAADRSPEGRGATVMTMLGSSLVLGQSLSAAVTGTIGEQFGATAALMVPAVAAAVVLFFAIVNWFLSAPKR